jgi:hypothetical protein
MGNDIRADADVARGRNANECLPGGRRQPHFLKLPGTMEMIERFLEEVSAPQLIAIATYWDYARGSRFMPSWTDLWPRAITSHLPHVWSYTYNRDLDAFIARLADKGQTLNVNSLRGKTMQELIPGSEFDLLHKTCRRVVLTPALYRGAGSMLSESKQGDLAERIILPLSADGVSGDGVLGATACPERNSCTERRLAFYETEYWLPVVA